MSNISRQQQADLAVDAYNTRAITKGNKTITIGDNEYKVLAVSHNRSTGYHGTVYQVSRCPNQRDYRCPQGDGTCSRRLARCLYRLDDGLQQCQLSGC